MPRSESTQPSPFMNNVPNYLSQFELSGVHIEPKHS